MLDITCKGTPYEIGHQHGHAAKIEVGRCIAFYADLFVKTSNKQWPEVLETARDFEAEIKRKWPRYHEEMRGIADASGHSILDIVAINVRTEIAFGAFTDGCTALYWKTPKRALLGQNWDWMPPQQENLILLTIHQPPLPNLKIVTEAGLIGKIGLNSLGVGVCFNAIRAKGLDATRIPVHLGLRMVLECSSARDAVALLEQQGMASSAHMLIADATEATGFEFTSQTVAKLQSDRHGRVIHSNHLLLDHPGVVDTCWLADSPFRVQRMQKLADGLVGEEPSWSEFSRLFEDEKNAPAAICRSVEAPGVSATLFNIVMDLESRRAVLRLGKPNRPVETVEMGFGRE